MAEKGPSWMTSMGAKDSAGAPPRASTSGPAGRGGAAPLAPPPPMSSGSQAQGMLDDAIQRLRDEARRTALADAEQGLPDPDHEGAVPSELDLRERCRGTFQRWLAAARRETTERLAESESAAADKLGRVALGIDRLQRITNELSRVKARYSLRRDEVEGELTRGGGRRRGIPTPVYAAALGFLGLVEFFANAPVFSALLPRDPLTERQIRLLTEMSDGWFAGAERVVAQLIFRPDATLLALGIITFLCVLCHFFGGSLRELVMQGDRKENRYTVQGRSMLENTVPLVLTGLGILLTLGVLYDARVTLGEVGEERFAQDMAQVEEYRREASWLRVDGELLAANQLSNRADDLQEAAVEMREYAAAMARMTFPVLLLNLTLVLAAISAAYFHRRDRRSERFDESPFEDRRQVFIEQGEEVAGEVVRLLAEVPRDIREVKSLITLNPMGEWPQVVTQLESVVSLYRAENGRVRGLDPRRIPAFAAPPEFNLVAPSPNGELVTRSPDEYEVERAELAARFNQVRARFNDEATATW
ncbi:MAG: hypothetical protein EA422_01685 [Gemmatimonadales bacterium]|nr:MAG: hypothetical protein EA422_01685 [Gemmatimonadales bacterium]